MFYADVLLDPGARLSMPVEQAKADWREGRFAPVPDETEWIPLPGEGPVVVRYP